MGCKIDGCTKQGKLEKSGNYSFVKGYCSIHYQRLKRNGYVNTFKRVYWENRKDDNRYKSYTEMKDRCININSNRYSHYGGRGITISDRWLGPYGFTNFCNDMGPKKQGLTLDRIDVNGNYEPLNCRWATWNEQAANKRNNNKCVGVSFYKRIDKWRAYLSTDKKDYFLGNFINFEDAVKARKDAELKYIK